MQKDMSLCLLASEMLSTKYHFWLMRNEEVSPTCQFFTDKGMFSSGFPDHRD